MSARWEPTPDERRAALLESTHPAATVALVVLLLVLLAAMAQVAG